MKDRVTPADIAGVIRLFGQMAQKPKDYLQNIVNQIKVIKLLTTRKWLIGIWDFYFIEDILKAAGLIGEKTIKVEDALEKMEELGAYLAANLGGTGHQILSNITPSEIEKHVKAISIKKLEGYIAQIKAHHLPKDFLSEIQSEYGKFDKNRVDMVKKIQEKNAHDSLKIVNGRLPNGSRRNVATGKEYITDLLASGIRA